MALTPRPSATEAVLDDHGVPTAYQRPLARSPAIRQGKFVRPALATR